jgi:DNA-binding ferritin-like protein
MNAFQKLLCLMKIQHNNLTTLHRNLVKDVGWFGNHPQLGEWYETLFDQLDDLTEIGLSLGFKEPTISEACAAGYEILDTVTRELNDTYTRALGILRSIIAAMESAEAGSPPDVVNKLQEYIYYWRKEANYKLAHALGEAGQGSVPPSAPKPAYEEDE